VHSGIVYSIDLPGEARYPRASIATGARSNSGGLAEAKLQRFVKDDAGYLAWLDAHPLGYVLNTNLHPTADYLILHRSTCRSISRQLPRGSLWTSPYIKTCSDDRSEVEAYARAETGGKIWPHVRCVR
jgi:hypothetical protein